MGEERSMEVLDTVNERKDELVFQAEVAFVEKEKIKSEVEHLLLQLHIRELKRGLEILSNQIRKGESEGSDISQLLENVKEKTKALHDLESKR